MGDHAGSPLQLYIIKTGGLNQMGLDRLFCFQGRECRGEKMLKALFVEFAVCITAVLLPIIAGLAEPFLGSSPILTHAFPLNIH